MWRLARWVWTSRARSARAARACLLPATALYRIALMARAAAYRSRLLVPRSSPLPTVSVGNLTVGGSGKTPVASWIARYYANRGVTPAVVLRGYGGDEAELHRLAVPQAVVIENPDRVAAMRLAADRGAQLAVLDDGLQCLDTGRALDIAVLSAESLTVSPWLLPAGPWREPMSALRRAAVVIVTRKRASANRAREITLWVKGIAPDAHVAVAGLVLIGFRELSSERRRPLETVRGKRIVVATAIGDPESFAAQCRALGSEVRRLTWRDHHRFDHRDICSILQAGRLADYVVVTAKDAAKLRTVWPTSGREPLVAQLGLVWDLGLTGLKTRLRNLAATPPEGDALRVAGWPETAPSA